MLGADPVRAPAERLDATNAEDVRADAVDIGAERHEEAAEVLHVRLTGSVPEGRLPLGEHRRHDSVLRPGDAGFVEEQRRAAKALGSHLVRRSRLDLGTERGERVDVGVDAAAADDVAARRRHCGGAEPGEQRPREQDGRPDLVAELLVELRRREAGRVDAHLVRPRPVGVRPRTADEREHRVHVEDPRDVSELHGLPCEQRRGEDRAARRSCSRPPARFPRASGPPRSRTTVSRRLDDGLHGDGSLPIPMNPTRDQAWETLTRYTKAEPLLRHALAVEASVGWYARHFAEDEERWRVVAPPSRFRLRDPSDARQAPAGRSADPA